MSVLLQISDLHLFTEPDGRLANVPTWDSLAKVLEHVDTAYPNFTRLIVTGDIAHDEAEPTYVRLAEVLGDRLPRCRFLPGNHDRPSAMRATFGPQGFPAEHGAGFVDQVPGWRLYGLDTHVPGEVGGRVGDAQLSWLRSALAATDEPAAIFLHHPPLEIGSNWDNDMSLEDVGDFVTLIRDYPQVRFVGCGHVHLPYETEIGAALVTATPSTAFQFTLHGNPRLETTRAPGFRVLEFTANALRTRVERLEQLHFPPQRA